MDALVEPITNVFVDVVEVSIGSVASWVDIFLWFLDKLPGPTVNVERVVAAPIATVGVGVVIEQSVLTKLPSWDVVQTLVENITHVLIGVKSIALRTSEINVPNQRRLW